MSRTKRDKGIGRHGPGPGPGSSDVRSVAQLTVLTPVILPSVEQHQERIKLSAAQAALLLDVIPASPPAVREAAERIAQGQVVPDDEAKAVVNVLAEAMFADGEINPAIDNIIGIVQQMSEHFYD
jgi:hypothetical protein